MSNYDTIPGFSGHINTNHIYYIATAINKDLENDLIDCHFWDDEKEKFREGIFGMSFDESTYYLMEKYLFNFINTECDLYIGMYEEEMLESSILPKVLSITEQMINNSDNEEFIVQAHLFHSIVEKAIELQTFVWLAF